MDQIPLEILSIILSFMPSLESLYNKRFVSKRFYLASQSDQTWKTVSLKQWIIDGIGGFQLLEDIMKEAQELDSTINWKWIGKCFLRKSRRDGLTFMKNKLSHFTIFRMANRICWSREG